MLSAFGSWRSPVGLLGESMEVEDPTAKQPGKINFRWHFRGVYAYRAWLSGIVFLVRSAHWQLLCSCQEYLKLLLENHEMRRLVTRDYTWLYPHIWHGHVVSERVFAFRWCSLWHENHPQSRVWLISPPPFPNSTKTRIFSIRSRSAQGALRKRSDRASLLKVNIPP